MEMHRQQPLVEVVLRHFVLFKFTDLALTGVQVKEKEREDGLMEIISTSCR